MGRSMLLALALVAASGCAPTWRSPRAKDNLWNGKPAVATVCLDLPDSELDGAKEAVAEWAQAISRWKILDIRGGFDDGSCWRIVKEAPMCRADPFGDCLAWTSEIGGREIWMVRGRYERRTKGILMHELGHSFGAQHVEGTLMNPTYQNLYYVCPDAEAVAQVAAWNRLNLDTLSWCVP